MTTTRRPIEDLPGPPLGNRDPAREAWALMVRIWTANKPRFVAISQDFDLSPMQIQALLMLGHDGMIGQAGMTMSSLAETLACDASNVTGIVDRLEDRGLLERRSSPEDRRVKLLGLTDEGRRLHAELGRRMSEPPPQIAGLSRADQRALRDLLRTALGA